MVWKNRENFFHSVENGGSESEPRVAAEEEKGRPGGGGGGSVRDLVEGRRFELPTS